MYLLQYAVVQYKFNTVLQHIGILHRQQYLCI